MILAYLINPHYNDTNFLGEETYSLPSSAGFDDWRYGRDGEPHPATCPACGRKTDPAFVNPAYRARRRGQDIGVTYDGCVIVSRRFRLFCEGHGWLGMEFGPLPADEGFFVLKLSRALPFDAGRRGTSFEQPCPGCGAYYNVLGATPAYLLGLTEPVAEGFFRSDLEFGSGHRQRPLIFVGLRTFSELRRQGFRKYSAEPVVA